VPEELDGAVVTNDFPVFCVNSDRLLPEYLKWFSRTEGFVGLCRAASEGTTNRVRLKEERFLAMELPLPPFPEQQRIVARIEELTGRVDQALRLSEGFATDYSLLIQSLRFQLCDRIPDSGWVPLATYVRQIENGWSPGMRTTASEKR
jgi:type I restriction enzyme S subunit